MATRRVEGKTVAMQALRIHTMYNKLADAYFSRYGKEAFELAKEREPNYLSDAALTQLLRDSGTLQQLGHSDVGTLIAAAEPNDWWIKHLGADLAEERGVRINMGEQDEYKRRRHLLAWVVSDDKLQPLAQLMRAKRYGQPPPKPIGQLLRNKVNKIGAFGDDSDDDGSSVYDVEMDPDDMEDSDEYPSWPGTGATAADVLAATKLSVAPSSPVLSPAPAAKPMPTLAPPPVLSPVPAAKPMPALAPPPTLSPLPPSSLSASGGAAAARPMPTLAPPPTLSPLPPSSSLFATVKPLPALAPPPALPSSSLSAAGAAARPLPTLAPPPTLSPLPPSSLSASGTAAAAYPVPAPPGLGAPGTMSSSSGVVYSADPARSVLEADDGDDATDVTEEDPESPAAATPSPTKRAPRPARPKLPEVEAGADRIDQVLVVPPALAPINYTGVSPPGDVLEGAPPSVILSVLARAHPFSHRRFMMNDRARQVVTFATLDQMASDASPNEFYESAVNAMLASARYRSVGMYVLRRRAEQRRSFVGVDSPDAPIAVTFFAVASGTQRTTPRLAEVAPELYKAEVSMPMLFPLDNTWSTSARKAGVFAQHPLTMAATGLVAAALNDMRDSVTPTKIKLLGAGHNTALTSALKYAALANLADRLAKAGSAGDGGKRFLALDDQFEVASGQTYSSLAYAQVGSYRDIIGYWAVQALDEAVSFARQMRVVPSADAGVRKKQDKQSKTIAVAAQLLADYNIVLDLTSRAVRSRMRAMQFLLAAEAKLKKKHTRRIAQMLRCYLLMQYSEWLAQFSTDGTRRWTEYFAAAAPPPPAAGGRKKARAAAEEDDDDDDDDESSFIEAEAIGADPEKRGTKRGAEETDIDIAPDPAARPDLMASQPVGNIFALCRTTTQAAGLQLVAKSELVRTLLADYTKIAKSTVADPRALLVLIGKAADAMTARPEDSFGMQAFLAGFGLRLAELIDGAPELERIVDEPFHGIWEQRAVARGQNHALLCYALQCVGYGVKPLQRLTAIINHTLAAIAVQFDARDQAVEFYVKSRKDLNDDRVTELSAMFANAVLTSKRATDGTVDEAQLARRVAAASAAATEVNSDIRMTNTDIVSLAGSIPTAARALAVLGTWTALDRSMAVSAMIAGHMIVRNVFLTGLHPDVDATPMRPVVQPRENFHMFTQLYFFAMRFAFQTEYLTAPSNRVLVDVALDHTGAADADYSLVQSTDNMLVWDNATARWQEMAGTKGDFPYNESLFTRRFHTALATATAATLASKNSTTLAVLRLLETAVRRVDSISDDIERREFAKQYRESSAAISKMSARKAGVDLASDDPRSRELATEAHERQDKAKRAEARTRLVKLLDSIAQRYRLRAMTLRNLALMKFVVDVGTFIGDPSVDGVQFPATTQDPPAIRALITPMIQKFVNGDYNRIRAFVAGAIMSMVDQNLHSIFTDAYGAVVKHTTGLQAAP